MNTVPFESLVAGLVTEALPEDVSLKAAFCLILGETETGETVWSARSGGQKLSSEELLGALEGLTLSLRQDLAADWEW